MISSRFNKKTYQVKTYFLNLTLIPIQPNKSDYIQFWDRLSTKLAHLEIQNVMSQGDYSQTQKNPLKCYRKFTYFIIFFGCWASELRYPHQMSPRGPTYGSVTDQCSLPIIRTAHTATTSCLSVPPGHVLIPYLLLLLLPSLSLTSSVCCQHKNTEEQNRPDQQQWSSQVEGWFSAVKSRSAPTHRIESRTSYIPAIPINKQPLPRATRTPLPRLQRK